MPIIALLAKHANIEPSDMRAIQALVSTYIKGRYGTDPEFPAFDDYFVPAEHLEVGEKEVLEND